MYAFAAILFMLVCTINGRPQGTQGPYSGSPASSDSNTTPIAILNETQNVIQPDGSFRFSYGTANGINFQENAYIKRNDNANARSLQGGNDTESGDILVIQGEVSYTAPDGQVINLRFIADENGYQPEGDHIPTPPGSQAQNQQDGNQIGGQEGNYRDQQSNYQQHQQYQGFSSQSTSQQYQGSSQSPSNQYQGSTSQSANNQYQQQGFSSQAPNDQ